MSDVKKETKRPMETKRPLETKGPMETKWMVRQRIFKDINQYPSPTTKYTKMKAFVLFAASKNKNDNKKNTNRNKNNQSKQLSPLNRYCNCQSCKDGGPEPGQISGDIIGCTYCGWVHPISAERLGTIDYQNVENGDWPDFCPYESIGLA